MSWISLEEARQRVAGHVEWYQCRGPQGELVAAPLDDRPVHLWENGDMYFGGWASSRFAGCGPTFHGIGVLLEQELITVGHWDRGQKVGLFKQSWLPSGICWGKNETSSLVVQQPQPMQESSISEAMLDKTPSTTATDTVMPAVSGLPYIYIGLFKDNVKEDPRATVMLKDGTTRMGPWKADNPVGDWWKDHKQRSQARREKLISTILSFEMQAVKSQNHVQQTSIDSGKDDNDENTGNVAATKKVQQGPPVNTRDVHVPNKQSDLKLSNRVGTTAKDETRNIAIVETTERTKAVSTRLVAGRKKPSGTALGQQIIRRLSYKDMNTVEPTITVATSTGTVNRPNLIRNQSTAPTTNRRLSLSDQNIQDSNISAIDLPCLDSVSFTTGSSLSSASSQQLPQRQQPPTTKFVQLRPKLGKQAQEQVLAISRWLEEKVIGFNANSNEMQRYARNLFDLGFHSVILIQQVCTRNDIASFVWMKPIHKRLFLANAQLQNINDSSNHSTTGSSTPITPSTLQPKLVRFRTVSQPTGSKI